MDFVNPKVRLFLIYGGPLLLIAAGLYFYFNNPYEGGRYLACPVKYATGLDCPGCGGQRAVHHLTHLRFWEALQENWLFVIGLPYVMLGLYAEYILPISPRRERLRQRLFGRTAIYIALVLIVGWWIVRNLI